MPRRKSSASAYQDDSYGSNSRHNNSSTMSAFSIHEDALYAEVGNARKRITHGHVALADATTSLALTGGGGDDSYSATASFCDLWETEIGRIGDYLQAQQQNLEFSAKALLTNVEAALHRLMVDQKEEGERGDFADDEERSSRRNTHTNSSAEDLLQNWRWKADELVDVCLKLQHFAVQNKEMLEEIGTYADEKLHTACLPGLKRLFAVAPWKTGPNSALIVVLSDIYDVLRSTEKRLQEGKESNTSEQWVAPSSFERSTTKFWVQDEQLTDLLLAAVSEAPLLVYGKSGRLTSKAECLSQKCEGDKLWDQLATPITSIYFDSPQKSLYQERLGRREGAQLLRARWYGRKPVGNEIVFLELKTHHEKWINTKSVKERVAIREKDMVKFLSLAEWTLQEAEDIALAATPTLDEAGLNRDGDRLLRMHTLVFSHGLRPCVRTCYLRAAFQSSKSNALRLTIDRNITMIDETKNLPGSWCLPEDSVIQNTMAARVPFVVLEVKIAGDDTMPPIFQDLQKRDVIQDAPKFSKFLTGAASFGLDKVGTLPYWAEHPAFADMFSTVGAPPPSSPPPAAVDSSINSDPCASSDVTTVTTDGKSDSASETETSGSDKASAETTHFFDSATIKHGARPLSNVLEEEAPTRRLRGSVFSSCASFDPTASSALNKPNASLSSSGGGNDGGRFGAIGGFFRRRRKRNDGQPQPQTLKVAPKRPARVEPKSYFANERTFIQWISAALLLVTISVILLGIDSEMGSTSTYARKSGIGVCAGAVVIVFYATYVYFRRLHLLSTGSAYGYIDHVGPFILACSVCVGVVVLLTHFLGEIEFARQQQKSLVFLHEQPGQCYLHSNKGISKLEYQPSDIVVDAERNALLVPSIQRIVAHSLAPPLPNRENRVKTLVEIPDSNIEGLTVIGDRVFALSEGPKRTELIELSWNGDDELSIVHRWKLSNSEEAEGITYVPDKTRRSGRLFVDVNGQIHIYEVPDGAAIPNTAHQDDDEDDDDSLVVEDTTDAVELERIGSLNNHVLTTGLKELKISSMFYFEGVAYILHDNEMLLRAWDLDEGDLLAEIPLPRVEGGFSKEWEGVALERREIVHGQSDSLLTERNYSLRGSTESTNSQLILHLALDTPAQVWSMVVTEGAARGSLILPSCAVSADTLADSVSVDESSDSLDHLKKT